MKKILNPLLIALGFVCVALGIIGAFVPVLPTTPFFILAAYLFSKSSKKFHQMILNLPTIGPLVKNWEDHGIISKKAKIWSTIVFILVVSSSFLLGSLSTPLKIMVSVIVISVMTFIWSRPTSPRRN